MITGTRAVKTAFATVLCLGLSSSALLRGAEAPRFSKQPTASKTAGGKVKIEFVLDRATDVAVFIENAKGKAVRHLVAGMIGKPKPVSKDAGSGGGKPPAPLKAGLAQSLEWDGLDDYGKKAEGGPFKVRVAAGLTPTFDGFLLGKPRTTGRIEALAVGPKGRLYAFNRNEGLVHWWSHYVKILDRDGKHAKTLMPFPADIDPERIKAIAPHKAGDGEIMPRIYQGRKFEFYTARPMLGFGKASGIMSPAVGPDGRVYWLAMGPRLACLDSEGGIPYDSFLGPQLLRDVKGLAANNKYKVIACAPSLAVSGEGKHVYFSGMSIIAGKKTTPLSCVYRVDLKTRSKAEVFVGKAGSPGKDKGLLTDPCGLAAAKGLLYVADAGTDRVVVFKEADRSCVGAIKVKSPYSLGVNPATGAIYVTSITGAGTTDLIKFDGYKSGKVLYKMALYRSKHVKHRIAVDASAKPVRIWLPSTGRWGRYEAICIEDSGTALARKMAKPKEGAVYRDFTIDRRRGELYVLSAKKTWLRIDEKTGKIIKTLKLGNNYGPQLVPAPDGSLISAESWGGGLRRYDRDGKPLNWPGQKTNRYDYGGIMNFMQRNLALTDLDNVYALFPPGYLTNNKKKKYGVTGQTRNTVDVIGADGKPKRTAVWQCTSGGILRVDHKGYVYLADMVTPPGRVWPTFFDDKFEGKAGKPASLIDNKDRKPDQFWLSYLYSSIVKFKPTGGAIWFGGRKGKTTSYVGKPTAEFLAGPSIKAGAQNYAGSGGKSELQGAEWYRFGFAPWGIHGSSWQCSCEGAGFDVDLFGRVFYPNVPQFRVEVVDAANNMIGTFGKYGNQDSGGKDATVKKPEIPMAWPLTVVASDTHAYVADTLNRRIVKVKLGYAAEASADLP